MQGILGQIPVNCATIGTRREIRRASLARRGEFIRLGFFWRQIGFVFRSHFKAVNLSGHFYEVMIVMYPIKIPSVRYVIVRAVCNTI